MKKAKAKIKKVIKGLNKASKTHAAQAKDLKSVIKTSPLGKIRVDIKKILEIDPDTKGLPKRVAGPNIKFSKDINTEFNKTTYDFSNGGKNYWGGGYGGHYYEADKWEDEYGNEVVYEDGEELCYYCGDKVVESISKVKNYRYCKGCKAEVYYDESIYDVDETPTLDKVNNVINTHY